MRIAVDTRVLSAVGTGSATYMRGLLRHLLPLGADSQFVLICADRSDLGELVSLPNATALVRGDASLCDDRWEQLVLPVLLREIAAEAFLSPALTVPMLKPCPYVMVVFDIGFESNPGYYAPRLRQYLRQWAPPSCRLADRIITLSQFAGHEICEQYAIPSDRIVVVPGFADELFRRVPDEGALSAARARYGIRGRFVLSVASLEPNKNLLRLVDAFGATRDVTDERWTLVLAGRPGADAGRVASAVMVAGLADRVFMPGMVPIDDLPLLYNAADILAFVSLYEGFGLPPLEAMSCGTPVLCSSATSLPEVVGEAARLVDPESTSDIRDGLVELMRSAPLRSRLGQAGLRRAGEFGARDAARRVLAVLYEVADSTPTGEEGGARPLRVLVRRTGARGDVLQSTPVLGALKAKYHGCALTYVTSRDHQDLLHNNPHVDHVDSSVLPLSTDGFDVVIDLDRAYEDAPDRAVQHRIQLYARRARVEVPDTTLVLQPTPAEVSAAAQLAGELGLARSDTVVGFGLRSIAVPARCWYDDRWQALADALSADGCRVVTFGAPTESGLSGEGVANAIGRADMREACALMGYCQLVVAVDTAWVHVAAAAHRPIVGLFGADLPECVLPPAGDWVGIRADIPCSPCFGDACCTHQCMERIDVETVHAQVSRKLRMLREGAVHRREVVLV